MTPPLPHSNKNDPQKSLPVQNGCDSLLVQKSLPVQILYQFKSLTVRFLEQKNKSSFDFTTPIASIAQRDKGHLLQLSLTLIMKLLMMRHLKKSCREKGKEIRNKTTRKKEEKKKEQEKERRKNKIEVFKKKKQEGKKEKEKKTGKKGGKKEENDQEKVFILKSKLSKEGTNTGMRALRQQYKTLVCRTSPNMIVKYFASGEKGIQCCTKTSYNRFGV
ncbi:hypothetical protein V2J09_006887 [Rumex salicifolius]